MTGWTSKDTHLLSYSRMMLYLPPRSMCDYGVRWVATNATCSDDYPDIFAETTSVLVLISAVVEAEAYEAADLPVVKEESKPKRPKVKSMNRTRR